MISSPDSLKLIQLFEDLRLKAYLDIFGVPTIGWGHTNNVKLGMTCTKEQADKWLYDEIHSFEVQVLKALNADEIEINQHQFDALVCFAYNLGTYTLVHGNKTAPITKVGKLWQALKSKQVNLVVANFMLYTNKGVRGLWIRRKAESMLFEGKNIDEIIKWVRQEQAKK